EEVQHRRSGPHQVAERTIGLPGADLARPGTEEVCRRVRAGNKVFCPIHRGCRPARPLPGAEGGNHRGVLAAEVAMTRAARVASIDVLPLLAAALQKFRGQAVGVLDDLDIEARRILEWIHHDRKEYWERELHRAQEKLNQ